MALLSEEFVELKWSETVNPLCHSLPVLIILCAECGLGEEMLDP